MKRKVLCVALALLLCMTVTLPAFADGEAETPPERVEITSSFGLKLISGTKYKMWAKINNPNQATVWVTLALYGASYNYITSVSTQSSNLLINLSKYVYLSSGTYHLRLNYTVNGSSYSWEKTYNI